MATPKKTPTPKRTTSKKTSVKKGAVKARPLTGRFYVVTIGIFVVAVTTVVVIGLLASSVIAKSTAKERLSQIKGVYKSLQLENSDGPRVIALESDVFGDKRVHSWDTSRTVASSKQYLYGDTVSNTTAALDAKIKAAGFDFIKDDSSANGVFVRYEYRSADNGYLRLTVVSEQFLDTSQNEVAMGRSAVPALEKLDTNAGPARVTVKVNLDANND